MLFQELVAAAATILGLCSNVEELNPAHAEEDTDQRERTAMCFSLIISFNQMEVHIIFNTVQSCVQMPLHGQSNIGPWEAEIAWSRQL